MAGLLDEFKDGLSETLSAGWNGISDFAGGLLEVDPELQAARDAKAAALKEARLTPDEFGNTPNAWMYNTERSTSTNPIVRIAENYLPNLGDMYTGSSEMIRNPKPTTKMFTDLGVGGVLNLSGGLLAEEIGVEQREMASQFADTIKTQFGSWENIGNMILDNPVDALGVFVGAGMSAAKLAQLAKNPALKPAVRNTLVSLLGEDPMDSIMSGVLKSNLNPGLAKVGESKIPMITYQGNNQGAIFGKLDMSKVGSNSGTKVEGHGLYVSESKDTGKRFARRDNEMMEEANAMAKIETLTPIEREIWDRLGDGYYPDTIRKDVMKNLSNPAERNDALRVLKDVEDRFDTALNQLYEIDLSDDAIKLMIRRNKRMKDQPKIVQDLMKKHNMREYSTGRDFYTQLTEEFADQIGGAGAERAASAYLNDNGIPGMKFPDKLGNAAVKYNGQPDPRKSNYVLYNADTTKILKRQDIPIELNTATEVGVSQSILNPPKNPMIAHHNLDEAAVLKHVEYGGIPMPSVAISKVSNPMTHFGQISLLGDSKLIEPSDITNTYPTDIYSGRAPVNFETYKDYKALDAKLGKKELAWHRQGDSTQNIKPGILEGQMNDIEIARKLGYNAKDYIDYKDFKRAVNDAETIRVKRLNEMNGEASMNFDRGDFVNYQRQLKPIGWMHNRAFHGYKEGYLGEVKLELTNPKGAYNTIGEANKNIDYTPEAALTAMRKQLASSPGSETIHHTVERTHAITTKPFKNLEDIQANRHKISGGKKGLFDADFLDDFESLLHVSTNQMQKIIPNGRQSGASENILQDIFRTGTVSDKHIETYSLTKAHIKDLKQIADELEMKGQEAQTAYFESKPDKIVDISDFKGAIVPNDINARAEQLLKDKGIKKIYRYGTKEERLALFKKFPELMFAKVAIPTGGLLTMLDEEQVN